MKTKVSCILFAFLICVSGSSYSQDIPELKNSNDTINNFLLNQFRTLDIVNLPKINIINSSSKYSFNNLEESFNLYDYIKNYFLLEKYILRGSFTISIDSCGNGIKSQIDRYTMPGAYKAAKINNSYQPQIDNNYMHYEYKIDDKVIKPSISLNDFMRFDQEFLNNHYNNYYIPILPTSYFTGQDSSTYYFTFTANKIKIFGHKKESTEFDLLYVLRTSEPVTGEYKYYFPFYNFKFDDFISFKNKEYYTFKNDKIIRREFNENPIDSLGLCPLNSTGTIYDFDETIDKKKAVKIMRTDPIASPLALKYKRYHDRGIALQVGAAALILGDFVAIFAFREPDIVNDAGEKKGYTVKPIDYACIIGGGVLEIIGLAYWDAAPKYFSKAVNTYNSKFNNSTASKPVSVDLVFNPYGIGLSLKF